MMRAQIKNKPTNLPYFFPTPRGATRNEGIYLLKEMKDIISKYSSINENIGEIVAYELSMATHLAYHSGISFSELNRSLRKTLSAEFIGAVAKSKDLPAIAGVIFSELYSLSRRGASEIDMKRIANEISLTEDPIVALSHLMRYSNKIQVRNGIL